MKVTCVILVALLSVGLYFFFKAPEPIPRSQLRQEYADKVVLVCGASSGIGEEVVLQLADVGARIMIVARRKSRLMEVQAAALTRGSPQVEYFMYDFSDARGSGAVIEATIEKFGRLDYLMVNHAAMVSGAFLAFSHQQEPDYIEKMFRINMFSGVQLVVKALPHLEASSGHVFVTSSIAGEMPVSFRHHLYCATKHALNGFFYSLQSELVAKKSNVGVTVGAFGLIITKDLGRLLDMNKIPASAQGSVVECARVMIEAYVRRPRTITYPTSNWFLRLAWLLHPNFHEMAAARSPTYKGGYDESVQHTIETAKKYKASGFQEGYQDGFIGTNNN